MGVVKIPNFWHLGLFDAIDQTPMDVMHVLLEGVCRKQVMRLFEEWVKTKRSKADELNKCIKNFTYHYSHQKNKISGVTEYDLKKNDFIISAGQMKTLILLFPFIFHRIVDINHEEYK